MAAEWGKLVTSIVIDYPSSQLIWPTFVETNRLVPKVFVKIGPTACLLAILNDSYYVKNVNEELLNATRATIVTRLMTEN